MKLPIHSPLDLACLKAALLSHHAALSGMTHTFRMLGAPEYAQVRAEADSTARMLLIVCEIERDNAEREAPVEAEALPPTILRGTRVQMNRKVGHIPKDMIGEVSSDGHYQAVYVNFGLTHPVQIVRDAFDILPPSATTLDMSSFELVQGKDGRWRHVSHKLALASPSWMGKDAALKGANGYATTPAAMSEMAHNYATLYPVTGV